MIRQFAAVGIRPASVAAKVHPDAEIESFNVACAYKARLGASASDTWDRSRNPACPTKPIRPGNVGLAIELHQLREMDAGRETVPLVRMMAISYSRSNASAIMPRKARVLPLWIFPQENPWAHCRAISTKWWQTLTNGSRARHLGWRWLLGEVLLRATPRTIAWD